MRPLRLSMTGFGPYKKNTVIDMESLGSGGLYLVTGDTGAGKTYIFDAITYALYGEMSGSGRDSRNVRSQYCADGEKTEVELVFEYRGKRYTVSRNPEYNRAKSRGEGFTKQTAGATLIMPDGSVIDGTSRVTDSVKKLLGIDRGQFCNIVMIAQGEFRKVLNAGTEERQKLFRKLFNTQPYNRLSDALKDLNKANQEAYSDCLRSMELSLSSVSCSFSEELCAKLDDLKARNGSGADYSEDTVTLISGIIDAGRVRQEYLADELKAAEDKLTSLSNTVAIAQEHRKNISSLNAARESVALHESSVNEARIRLDEAMAAKPLAEKLENDAALLEVSMTSYDELDSVSKTMTEIEADINNCNDQLGVLREEAEALASGIAGYEAELAQLSNAGRNLIILKNRIEKTDDRKKALNKLIEDIASVHELRRTLKEQQASLEPVISEADRLETEHSHMLSAYLREQAGILAVSLSDGKPCPVCGSVHHPKPAKISGEAPSSDDIEEALKAAKAARKKASDKAGEAQKTGGRLNTAEAAAAELALRETGSSDLDEAEKAASAEIRSLSDELISMKADEKALTEKADRYDALNGSIPELKKKHEKLSAKVQSKAEELNKANTAFAAAKARHDQISKDLAYGCRDEAEKELNKTAAEAKQLRDSIEAASNNLNEAVSAKNANDTKISELEKVVAGYTPVDEDKAKADAEETGAYIQLLKDESIMTATELKSAETALNSVRTASEKLRRIRRDHEIIDPLSRTASGALTGKEKISLETYVQAFYFERIIRRANLRLRMMSEGQYEFVRTGGTGDKRHQTGLDLSVADHYSGTERPVNTLSGGESFMASLSLALGLSDEVQASAGGIRLDTMFVDEGFGSLDSETLEKAIRTLTELSDEDRLVGIISHVEALKSRIDKQIIVTKDREAGSRASIVV